MKRSKTPSLLLLNNSKSNESISRKRPSPRKASLNQQKKVKVEFDENDNPNDYKSNNSDQDEDYEDEDSLKPLKLSFNSKIPLTNRKATLGISVVSFKNTFQVPNFLKGDRPVGVRNGGSQLGVTKRNSVSKFSLYDPEAEGALILYVPKETSGADQLTNLKSVCNPLIQKVDIEVHVIVDPMLSKVLRPHQIEGVKFLYDCVTGKKKEGCFGCIMADEMGLGKTLQCITLLWTLLKQSPNPGKPTIEKCIIACPSSLVKNWANELKKWLGADRIHPYACDNKGSKEQTTRDIEIFSNAKGRGVCQPVLIISYETLRAYTEILKKTEIGLLLCDEGHRLKNAENQTYAALNSLNAKRRVILSGTPIQNDLLEYFSLLSFAIPDVLGTGGEFRRKFENPILRGRDSMATDKEKEISEQKLEELLAIANQFIIRRTAALLTKYLPVKYEHMVFCKLTPLQTQIYQNFTKSKEIRKLLNGDGKLQPLQAITNLKKLCNHPSLLIKDSGEITYTSSTRGSNKKLSKVTPQGDGFVDMSIFPEDFDFSGFQSHYSGKMMLLESMLTKMRKESKDKIVLISNYTQTLDLFQKMCRIRRWQCVRLDGSLTIKKRMQLVDQFNEPNSEDFVFLLSSKAGGCGLNLIGANRLVLFDPDWNPANDNQALARIWRDGQKKTCFIYRFIATGTIEEKIFQRQAHKQSLSSCVVDEAENVERHFSIDSLRQLFELNSETLCDTHDTFKCKRCVKGKQVKGPPDGKGYSSKSKCCKVEVPEARALIRQHGIISVNWTVSSLKFMTLFLRNVERA
ncbi:DNA-dependent ATPase protein rad54 [Lobulomyces angularis]|nr:DNA-dependent ATPase protein rad54 [Lobulomyces angularis]